jgi:hypothetical protein
MSFQGEILASLAEVLALDPSRSCQDKMAILLPEHFFNILTTGIIAAQDLPLFIVCIQTDY